MACPEGLEPPTYSLEGYCSIRLSYGQSLHRYGTDSAGAKRPIIPAGTARSTHENRGNTNAPAARCVPARMVGTGRRGRGDGRAVRSRTGRRNVRTGGAGRHVKGRSCWLRFLRGGNSPAAKCRRALARAAGDSQREMRIVVVEDGENERAAGLDVIAEMAPNDPRRSFKKAMKPVTWPDCSPVRRAMAMAMPSCSPSSRSLYRTPLRCMVLSERGIRATPCPSATRLKRIW